MKKLLCFSLVCAIVFFLCACGLSGRNEQRTVYNDAAFSAVACGRSVTITDAETGEAVSFTAHRTRRARNDSTGTATKTQTKNLDIFAAFNVVMIIEKRSGQSVFIKVG